MIAAQRCAQFWSPYFFQTDLEVFTNVSIFTEKNSKDTYDHTQKLFKIYLTIIHLNSSQFSSVNHMAHLTGMNICIVLQH